MKPVRETRDNLKAHYSQLSSKTATRIVALSNFFIGFTESYLESCEPKSQEEQLLMDNRLKQKFDQLEEIQTILEEYSLVEVVVAEYKDKEELWFVIGFEDDILADKGEEILREKSENAKEFSVILGSTPIPILFEDKEDLYPLDEIKQILKDLATSADSSQKIEAMNKIMLTSLDSTSRAKVLLTLVGDSDQEVLKMASQHLAKIGLTQDIPESYALLIKEDIVEGRAELVRRFGHIKNFSELDKEVVPLLLRAILKDEKSPIVVAAVVETLTVSKVLLSKNLSQFIPLILTKLLDHLHIDRNNGNQQNSSIPPLVLSTRQLFAQLGEQGEEEFFPLVFEELEKRSHDFLRAFVLEVLAQFATNEEQKKKTANLIVENLIRESRDKPSTPGDEFNPQITLLVAGLKHLKSFALPSLIHYFKQAKSGKRRLLLEVINEIVRFELLSPEEQRLILQFYIDWYRDLDLSQRKIILESRALESQQDALLGELTLKFSYKLEVIQEEMLESLGVGIRRIGGAALPPLFKLAKETERPVLRERLLFLLGNVALSTHFEEKYQDEISKALDWLLKFFGEAPVESRGEIGLTLGKFSSCSLLNEEQVREIANDLLNEIHQITSYDRKTHYKLLEAVGFLGGSKKLPNQELINISDFFLKILSRPMPENLVEEKQTKEGKLFEFSDATLVYTEVIPRILLGLGKILIRKQTPQNLSASILIRLINRFRDIISYRVIWAPSNIIQIAQTLAKTGISSNTSIAHKHQIIQTLLRRIENKQILILLADLVVVNTEPEFDEYMVKVLESTLEQLESSREEEAHIEDRILLLNNLITLLKRDKSEVNSLLQDQIESIIEALTEGIRDNVPGIYDNLRRLYLTEECSPSIKTKLQKILETNPF